MLTNRAAALLMTLNYKDALTDCNAALKLDVTNSKAYFRKATACKGLGKLDEAISALTIGLQHDPKSTTALKDKEGLTTAKAKMTDIQSMLSQKRHRAALPLIDTLLREIGSTFRDLNLMKVECLLEVKRPQDAYNLTNIMVITPFTTTTTNLALRSQLITPTTDT